MPMCFDEGGAPNTPGGPREGAMDLVASHQRLLVGCALRTKGPMLELGCGWYSSPILHEIALAQRRRLVTLDNNEHWLQQFSATKWSAPGKPRRYGLGCEHHELRLVGWWGDADLTPPGADRWGLVFVDNGQPAEREYLIRRLIDLADVMVLHDVEEAAAYGYGRTLKMFRYQWHDICQQAEAAAVSNTVDVAEWFRGRELPRCTPSKEVT